VSTSASNGCAERTSTTPPLFLRFFAVTAASKRSCQLRRVLERPIPIFYFFRSETPSRIRSRPLGVVPPPGARGANLVTFAVCTQGCVRRSNADAHVYVHVAPSNLGRGRGCLYQTRPRCYPAPGVCSSYFRAAHGRRGPPESEVHGHTGRPQPLILGPKACARATSQFWHTLPAHKCVSIKRCLASQLRGRPTLARNTQPLVECISSPGPSFCPWNRI
jgi:hypothetical protein